MEYAAQKTIEHSAEVRKGDRFEFGANWKRFLLRLSAERIELAESSLRSFLQTDRLDGLTFLDVGSGSGLFSLAARRLGARVRSFDYDPQSVACTKELQRRYFPDEREWIIEQGSVLDEPYLRSLGAYDVVYSWGVLHHTGAMWQALENVKPLVKERGQIYIAIYNDQGEATDRWAAIKQRYNALPRSLAFLFASGIIVKLELKELFRQLRSGTSHNWLRTWTEYDKISTRGMSRWHDWIDWIGGYPYERASVDDIVEVFAKDGFRLTKLMDRTTGHGCNEFVFKREAPLGTYVDAPIPGGRSITRRFGRRITEPFVLTDRGWTGRVRIPSELVDGTPVHLFRDDEIVGPATFAAKESVVLPLAIDEGAEAPARFYVIAGERRGLEEPYEHVRGNMWQRPIPDLTSLADTEGQGNDTRSCVFIFEDGRQLPYPHAVHDEIAAHGGGRFSHWHGSMYFSASDSSDPNTNGRRYDVMIARWE